MSKLLELFGKAITVNTSDLIWHWLNATQGEGASQDGATAEQELREAIELLGELELDKAEEKVKFYLFEKPDCVRARLAAVAICLHRNEPEEAIEQLQSIYMRQPSNTMALYTLGHCHERLGREAEAIEFYQDCLKFKSHLQLPRQRMAAIYFKNGRLDRVIREYELLTTEHPEDMSSVVLLGYLYVEAGEYEKAVDTFNTAIVMHPDNFHDEGQQDELMELVDSEQFDAACERVEWLMETVGEMPDLHVKMGDILSRAGRGSEAIVQYENALRLQPNYLEATIKLGTNYLRFNRLSLAAEQFNRAVEINDEIVDAYIGRALGQHFSGECESSAGTLSLSAAIQHNSTLLFSETATLHLEISLSDTCEGHDGPSRRNIELSDVIKAHSAQMTATPHNSDVHYKFGMLMMAVGQYDDAVKSFENTLRINPTHYRARGKLAICQYELGDHEGSVGILSSGQCPDASTLKLHYETAILFCDRQRFSAALTNLEHAMNSNFTQADAASNISVVLENLGLLDRATATWERLNKTAHHAISERYR